MLRAAAAIEATSLLVLLVNLVTVHLETVAGIVGPLHGAAYLAVIVTTLLREDAPVAARWWALLPGIGGLLAVRTLQRAQAA